MRRNIAVLLRRKNVQKNSHLFALATTMINWNRYQKGSDTIDKSIM